eukprot:3588090-Pleurochrysis_carterae.AAC.1
MESAPRESVSTTWPSPDHAAKRMIIACTERDAMRGGVTSGQRRAVRTDGQWSKGTRSKKLRKGNQEAPKRKLGSSEKEKASECGRERVRGEGGETGTEAPSGKFAYASSQNVGKPVHAIASNRSCRYEAYVANQWPLCSS